MTQRPLCTKAAICKVTIMEDTCDPSGIGIFHFCFSRIIFVSHVVIMDNLFDEDEEESDSNLRTLIQLAESCTQEMSVPSVGNSPSTADQTQDFTGKDFYI